MEAFELPNWFKHEGNEELLEPLWQALEGINPELFTSMLLLDVCIGKYLDIYGQTFGVCRLSRETDEQYRERIRAELLHTRSTGDSLESALNTAFPDNIFSIETTYTDSPPTFDGTYSFDGTIKFSEYGPYLPLASFTVSYTGPPVAMGRISAVLERFRPAGYIPVIDTSLGLHILDGTWVLDGSVVLLDSAEDPYTVIRPDKQYRDSCGKQLSPVILGKCYTLDGAWNLDGSVLLKDC